jgi:hypothetical protein
MGDCEGYDRIVRGWERNIDREGVIVAVSRASQGMIADASRGAIAPIWASRRVSLEGEEDVGEGEGG